MIRQKKTSIHTIGVVARYCGLSPEVIRAWETRYRAVSPQRTERGQRVYNDADIQRLILLAKACRGGRRISDIVQLSDAKLVDMIEQDEGAHEPIVTRNQRQSTFLVSDYIESCITAIKDFDSYTLFQTLTKAEKSLGTVFMVEDLLTPLLTHIRDECRRGNLLDGHRKIFNSLIKTYLIMLGTRREKERFTAVVCSLEDDLELSGLKTLALVAAYKWHPIYLDARSSVEDISDLVNQASAKALIFVSCGSETNDDAPNLLRRVRQREPQIDIILYAPTGNSYRDVTKEIKLTQCKRLKQLQFELDKLML